MDVISWIDTTLRRTDTTAMVIFAGVVRDGQRLQKPRGRILSRLVTKRKRPIPQDTAPVTYRGGKHHIVVWDGNKNTFQLTLQGYYAIDYMLNRMRRAFFTGPSTNIHIRPTNTHRVINVSENVTIDIPALRAYVNANRDKGIRQDTCTKRRRMGTNIIYLAMPQMAIGDEPERAVSVVISRMNIKILGAKTPSLYIHFVRVYLCESRAVLRDGVPVLDHRIAFRPIDGYDYHFRTEELRRHVCRVNLPASRKGGKRIRGERSKHIFDTAIQRAFGPA